MTTLTAGSRGLPGSLAVPASPAHQRIYEDLRARIATGELAVGVKLPTQQDLSASYHCSVQPVKRALQRLEFEGLIESLQGVGAFVRRQP